MMLLTDFLERGWDGVAYLAHSGSYSFSHIFIWLNEDVLFVLRFLLISLFGSLSKFIYLCFFYGPVVLFGLGSVRIISYYVIILVTAKVEKEGNVVSSDQKYP